MPVTYATRREHWNGDAVDVTSVVVSIREHHRRSKIVPTLAEEMEAYRDSLYALAESHGLVPHSISLANFRHGVVCQFTCEASPHRPPMQIFGGNDWSEVREKFARYLETRESDRMSADWKP